MQFAPAFKAIIPITNGRLPGIFMKYRRKWFSTFVHFAIWVCYALYESSLFFIMDIEHINLCEELLNLTLYAALFYLNALIILPKLVTQRKYIPALISLIVLISLFVLTRYLLKIYVIPFFDNKLIYPYTSAKIFLAESIWRGGYFIALSFGYWFALNSIKGERKGRKLEERKRLHEHQFRKLENSLLEAEMSFLKAQINPHFLYNSLNFFYAQVYPLSENAAKGLLLLSNIMRYALREEDFNGKVMLEKEVKHLEDYIALNQLRFNNSLQIKLEVKGNIHYRMIMPLVLISFVENCFKHGELLDPENPVIIRIRVNNDKMVFFTRNKKRFGPKEGSTGIGLENIRKRLNIKYKERYSLNIYDEENFYSTTLIIKL